MTSPQPGGRKTRWCAAVCIVLTGMLIGPSRAASEETALKDTSRIFAGGAACRTDETVEGRPSPEGKGDFGAVGVVGRKSFGTSVTGDVPGQTLTPYGQIRIEAVGFARREGGTHSTLGGRIAGDLGVRVRAGRYAAVEPFLGVGYDLLKWYRKPDVYMENLHGRVGARGAISVGPDVVVFAEGGIRAPNYKTIRMTGAPVYKPGGALSDFAEAGIEYRGVRIYYFREKLWVVRDSGNITSRTEINGVGVGIGY